MLSTDLSVTLAVQKPQFFASFRHIYYLPCRTLSRWLTWLSRSNKYVSTSRRSASASDISSPAYLQYNIQSITCVPATQHPLIHLHTCNKTSNQSPAYLQHNIQSITCIPVTKHPINHLCTCNTTSNQTFVTMATKHSNQSLPEYMEHGNKLQMFSIT